MERIDIQLQDITGNWRTMNSMFVNNSQMILAEMKKLKENFPEQKENFPEQRVRAVDQDGRLVDIL